MRFTSAKPMRAWNAALASLSSSQSLANSAQPLSRAQASHARSSACAKPRRRKSGST